MKKLALVLFAVGLSAQPEDVIPKDAVAIPAQVAPAKPVAPPPKPATDKPKTTTDQSAASVKGQKSESFHYNINWPSGLSLGEADLTASAGEGGMQFSFRMDASIPGFAVTESATSRATQDFCSIELKKEGTRGKRKVDERTEFDASKMKATRVTEGGGKSDLSTSQCAKDALTFVHFIRRELAAGRLPPHQKVYYGGAYGVHVTFTGSQRIPIGDEGIEADKLTATIKGPVTEVTADLFFAKDSTRTLLLVQVPLAVGKFSMELAR
jgi:hypothetical protein